MPIRHILLALLVVAIWGFNFVVIKLSVAALPPLLAASLRFAFAAVPLVFFVKPPKVAWPLVVAYGFAIGVGLYGFLNLSMAWGMSAGLSSLALQTQAFFTMALAFVLLGERPERGALRHQGLLQAEGEPGVAIEQGRDAELAEDAKRRLLGQGGKPRQGGIELRGRG